MKLAALKHVTRTFLVLGMVCMGVAKGDDPLGAHELLHFHFSGLKDLGWSADESTVHRILALPESRALWNEVLPLAAKAMVDRWFGGSKVELDDSFASQIASRLQDLVDREWWLTLDQSASGQLDLLGGIHLPEETKTDWINFLKLVGTRNNDAETVDLKMDGFSGVEWTSSASRHRFAVVRAGNWLVFGTIHARSDGFSESLQALRNTGRPMAALPPDHWLVARIQSGVLKPAGFLGALLKTAHIDTKVWKTGDQTRSEVRFTFPHELSIDKPQWKIPHDTIQDPLISFMAARGIESWLRKAAESSALEWSEVPNQLFSWSQFYAHAQYTAVSWALAAPVDSAHRQIAFLGPRIVSKLQDELKPYFITVPNYAEADGQVVWNGLPSMQPMLRSVQSKGQDYLLATVAGLVQSTDAPPAALYDQFQNREEVLFYHWELTQPRIAQWRHFHRLLSLQSSRQFMNNRQEAYRWLDAIAPFLGNTVTEVTQQAPKEIVVLRRSHIGLSAIELMALADWMAEPDFPRQAVRPPFQPLRSRSLPTLPRQTP